MNYQSNYRRYNQMPTENCPCKDNKYYIQQKSPLPECPVVAMAYVPFQTDTTVYDECKALMVGTLFPALNLPFTGVCGVRRG